MAFTSVWIFTLLAVTVTALPQDYLLRLPEREVLTTCSTSCFADTYDKFRYQVGHVYTYNYETTVTTHVPRSNVEERSMLHVTANADIYVISPCEMSLRLYDVVLEDADPRYVTQFVPVPRAPEFKAALERSRLHFSFKNGYIESVCPGEGEETWVLNVKRALLSTFQNKMADLGTDSTLTESDVSGDCPVTYEALGRSWTGVHTIRKVKNLEQCTSRIDANTIFQATPYHTGSGMQSLPVVRASQYCTQTISSSGILEENRCHESHVFRPLSSGDTGATTGVMTRLRYKTHSQQSSLPAGLGGGAMVARLPLTFDHSMATSDHQSTVQEAQDLLQNMCERTTPGIKPDAPASFRRLINNLRHLNAEGMVQLHTDIRQGSIACEKAERFLHDALPAIGTTASVHLMKKLILNGEVTGQEKSTWLDSLSFLKHPSTSLISEIIPLLRHTPTDLHAILSITSLVHNFCNYHTACGEVEEMRSIVQILNQKLGNDCSSGDSDEVLVVLKGLGNIGHAEVAVETLNMCMVSEGTKMSVRVAAIQAFRRMSCTADKDGLWNVFSNSSLDSELRINAYLALMTCPTSQTLHEVTRSLELEEINQVGSFIWTHLTNLQETSHPLKQHIKSILSKEKLQKTFDLDKRKFSRNVEKSFFSEAMNSGMSFDSNLIWSGESFVPRSASVNLTFDLFGQSVNLLEVGGRVEGMDRMLQSLFDKNSPPEDNKKTPRDIQNIDRQYQAIPEPGPSGSYFMRVFGNEISYEDFQDLDLTSLKENFNYLSWLHRLTNNHQVAFSKSLHFLDTSLSMPTMAGFPLRLRIEGNAEVQLDVQGIFEIYQLFRDPRNMLMQADLSPSAAVDIRAEMVVDAMMASTGVKTQTSLHTDTAAEVKLQLKDGQIFMADLNLPRQNTQVINARHQFFVSHREVDRPQYVNLPRTEISSCLTGYFSTITGLDVCTEISLPTVMHGPLSLLTSPMAVSVFINKVDTVTNYHFEAKLIQTDYSDNFKLMVDTPGSEIDRELSLMYVINRQDKAVNIKLNSPWKKIDITGATVSGERHSSLTAKAMVDNKHTYKFEINLRKDRVGETFEYRPSLIISLPNQPKVELQGHLAYLLASDHHDILVDVGLRCPWVDLDLNGHVENTPGSAVVYRSRFEIKYRWLGRKAESLLFHNKLRYDIGMTKKEFSLLSSMKTTLRPEWDYEIDSDIMCTKKSLVSNAHLSFSGRKILLWKQSGILDTNVPEKTANLNIQLEMPSYSRWKYQIESRTILSSRRVDSSSVFKSSGEEVARFDLKDEISDTGGSVIAKLQYPGQVWNFRKKLQKNPDNTYQLQLILDSSDEPVFNLLSQIRLNSKYEISAEVYTRSTGTIKFDGAIRPNWYRPELHGQLVYTDRKYGVAAMLERLGSNAENFKTNLSITHPAKSLGFSADISYTEKEMKGACEMLVDEEKVLSMSGQMHIVHSKPLLAEALLELKAEQGQRYIDLRIRSNFNPKYKLTFFNNRFDLETSLKTSIKGVENVSFALGHEDNSLKTVCFVRTSSTPKKGWEFVNEVLKKNGETDFGLRTKFIPKSRHGFYYNLSYKIEDSRFAAETQLRLGRELIEMDISGEKNGFNIAGNATSKIYWNNKLQSNISGMLVHVSDGKKSLSDVKVSWSPKRFITARMLMDKTFSERIYSNDGQLNLTFVSPYKTETPCLQWHHKLIDNTFATKASLVEGKHCTEFQMDGILIRDETKHGVNITGQFMKRNRKPYNFAIYHSQNSQNQRNTKTSILFHRAGDWTLDIQNDLNFDPKSHLMETLTIKEQMHIYKLQLNNRVLGKQITARNSLKIGEVQQILNADLDYDSLAINVDARVKSKYSYRKERFSIKHEPAEDKRVLSLEMEHRGKKYVSAFGEIGTGLEKQLSLSLDCPKEKFNLQAVHKGDIRNFSSKCSLSSDHFGKMSLEGNANTEDLRNVKLSVAAKTPFPAYPDIKVFYNHNREEEDGIVCHGSFQISENQKIDFHNRMRLTDFMNLRTKSVLEHNNKQRFTLVTSLTAREDLALLLSLQTAVDKFEIALEHKGRLFDSETQLKLDLGRGRDVAFTNRYYHARDIHFLTKILTPFSGYQEMEADFNFEGYMDDYKQDWSFKLENNKVAGQNIFYWKGERLDYTSRMQTPFRRYKDLEFTFLHNGKLEDFKQKEGTFEYPSKKYTYSKSFRLSEDSLTTQLKIETPLRIMRVLTLNVYHSGNLHVMENKANLKLNGIKYDIGSNWKMQGSSVHMEAFANTPEEYSFSVKHNGTWMNFDNQLQFQYGIVSTRLGSKVLIEGDTMKIHAFTIGPIIDVSLDLGTMLNISEERLRAEAVIEIPQHKGSILIHHKGPRHNFTNEFTIVWDEAKINGRTELSIYESDTKGSMTFTAPKFGFSITGNHDFELEETAKVDTGIQMRNSYISDLQATGSISITTVKSIHFAFDHKGKWNNFRNKGTIVIDGVEYTSQSSFKKLGNVLKANAGVFFPSNYSVEIDHNLQDGFLDSDAKLLWNDIIYSGHLNAVSTEGTFHAKGMINTPEEYSVTVEEYVSKDPFELTNTITIKLDKDLVRVENKIVKNNAGQNITLTSKLTTPYESVRHAILEVKGFPSEGDIHAQAVLQVNEGRSFRGKLDFAPGSLDLSFSAIAFNSGHSVHVNAWHKGYWNDFQNNFQVNIYGIIYRANTHFKVWRDNLAMKATVSLPLTHFPHLTDGQYSVMIKHKGDRSAITDTIEILMDSKRININSVFANTNGALKADMRIITPFENFQKMTFRFTHNGSLGNLQTVSSLDTSYPGYETFGFDIIQKGSLAELKASVSLYTPFTSLQNAALIFNQKLGQDSYQQNFAINYNRESVIGVSTYQKLGDTLKLTSALQTTFNNFEKFDLNLKHEGVLNDFKTTIELKTPLESFPDIDIDLHHILLFSKIDSGFLITDGYEIISGNFKFEKKEGIKLETYLQTPRSLFGKTSISFAHWEDGNGMSTTFNIETPLEKLPNAGFSNNFKKTSRSFDGSLSINFIETMDIEIAHIISDTEIMDSATLSFGNTNGKLVNTFQRKPNGDLVESGTLETSISGYERFTFSLLKTQSENKTVFFSELGHPWQKFKNLALKFELQHSDPMIAKGFDASIVVTTPVSSFSISSLKSTYKRTDSVVSASFLAEISGQRTSLELELSNTGDISGIVTSVEIPIDGYDTFSLTLRREKKGDRQIFRGEFDHPFNNYNNPSFYLEIEPENGFKTSGTMTTPFRDIGTTMLEFKFKGDAYNYDLSGIIENRGKFIRIAKRLVRTDERFDVTGKIETSFSALDIAGFELKSVKNSPGLGTINLSIMLPKDLGVIDPSFDIHYGGNPKDLRLDWKIFLPYLREISGSFSNQIALDKGFIDLELIYGGRAYQIDANYKNQVDDKKVSAYLTTPLKDKFSFDGLYNATGDILKLKAKLGTPFEQYEDPAFTITYQKSLNNITSRLEVLTPVKDIEPIILTFDLMGHSHDFVSNFMVEFSGQSITINSAFENVGNIVKAAAEVHTPFTPYEHFGFSLGHNAEGRTARATVNLIMPFVHYANPAIDMQYQISGNNLEAKLTLTTPFKWLDPIQVDLMHSGVFRDFRSEVKLTYQQSDYHGHLRFKYEGDKLDLQTMLMTSIPHNEKFALNVEHIRNTDRLMTKWKVDTPYEKFQNLELELMISGILSNFKVRGLLKTPLENVDNLRIEVAHNGIISEFDTLVLVELNKVRYDGQVQFRKKSGWRSPTTYDFFGKIGTPFSHLEEAEAIFALEQSKGRLKGDVRGTYNGFNFDSIYEVVYTDIPRLVVEVRQPKQMELDLTLNMDQNTLVSRINWDKSSSDSFITVETTWQNENSVEGFNRQLIINIDKEAPLIHFEMNIVKGNEHVNGKSEIVWKSNQVFFSEVDFSKKSKEEVDVFEGRWRGNTYQVTMNHEIRAGGRYVSEINLQTREKLTLKSDVRVRYPRSKATIILQHPDLSEDIIIDLDGAVGTDILSYAGTMDLTYGLQKVEIIGRVATEVKPETLGLVAEAGIKHRQSHLDASIEAKAETGHGFISGDIELEYLMATNGHKKAVSITSRLDHRENLVFQVLTNVKPVYGSGHLTKTKQGFTHKLQAEYKPLSSLRAYSMRSMNGYTIHDADFHIYQQGHLIKADVHLRPRSQAPVQQLVEVGTPWPEYEDVTRVVQAEMHLRKQQFAESTQPLKNALHIVYSHNDYYFKDISDWLLNARAYIIDVTGPLERKVQLVFDDMTDIAKEKYQALYQIMALKLKTWYTNMPPIASSYLNSIHTSMMDVVDYLYHRPAIQRMKSLCDWLVRRTASYCLEEVISTMDGLLDAPYINTIKPWLQAGLDQILATSTNYQKLADVRTDLQNLRDSKGSPLWFTMWHPAQHYFRPDLTRINTWAPVHGSFSVQFYIPSILQDLKSISTVQSYVPNPSTYLPNFRHIGHNRLLRTDIKELLPPYKAHATVGGNHFVTFDRRVFNFLGECSYLLARDFVDGTFSIIINYEIVNGTPVKRSITAIHSDQQVEIFPDARVKINDVKTDLPVFTDYINIYRDPNSIVLVNKHGVNVTCHIDRDICTISVSGWYHGKVAGLLGTIDNEPATDYTMSNRQRTTTVTELAKSWTVGAKCPADNHAEDLQINASNLDIEFCMRSFKDNASPLKPCFNVLDPKAFIEVCHQSDPCQLTSLYAHECHLKDMHVGIPEECASCMIPNAPPIPANSKVTLHEDNLPESADIIFVLSHGSCNKKVIEQIPLVAHTIKEAFKPSGRSVYFGLVGYGGSTERLDPHFHTMDGQLLNSVTTLSGTLQNFSISNSNEFEDAMNAISFVAHFPFRAGVTKTVILVPCEGCGQEDHRYGDLQTLLYQKNIRLHVMMDHYFRLKKVKKSLKSSYIFGMDRDSVFTGKHAVERNLLGDFDLYHQVKGPKDLCAALTNDMDGAVFDVNTLTDTKTRWQKRFNIVVSRVVLSKARQDACQVCDCHNKHTSCHSCESPLAWARLEQTKSRLP